MFAVGQKVVCVDDGAHDKYIPPGILIHSLDMHGLKNGVIYTVRQVLPHWLLGIPTITLVEIKRPIAPGDHGNECGYCVQRFRPVVESKTDISALKALLNTNHQNLLEGV